MAVGVAATVMSATTTSRTPQDSAREREAPPPDEALTARGLMTAPAITVATTSSTLWAARLMDRHHVKRLPVVDRSGRLVGIVSRCDLLGALVRSDAEIRTEIEREVLGEARCLDPGTIEVEIRDAVVQLTGEVDHPTLVDVVTRRDRPCAGRGHRRRATRRTEVG
ncbi:CBS domain-containing protein [Embleya sp. NPDC008237]|uniref:CBS domain-containing protein n=1 Tax=Embleya sp. NPDC008237 TaxID=3363978 RepID=UPI0036E3F8E7